MKSLKMRLIGLALLGFFVSTPAQSALVYDLTITNPFQTVAPGDTVLINGQFINDITSTESLDLDAAVGTVFGTLFGGGRVGDVYTPDFGPLVGGNFQSQFNGVTINPGETFDFVFLNLIPDPAPVPDGDYFATNLGIDLTLPGISNIVREVAGFAIVTVEDSSVPPPNPNPIPLPAGVWLFGTALAGLLGWRRKQAAG